MGITTVQVRLGNVANPDRQVDVDMIVDSGAIYCIVPAPILRGIGIEPQQRETFRLADGRNIRRDVGHALFDLQGRCAPSRVIFGKRGDACLLGMVALEELGLTLDPLKRRLRARTLMIA